MRFDQAITTAAENHATFIEISPHPLLTHAITDTIGQHSSPQHPDAATRHAMRRCDLPHQPQRHPHHPPATHRSIPPNRTRRCPPPPGITPSHWITGTAAIPAGAHPLLGIGVTDPTNGARVWENTLSPDFCGLAITASTMRACCPERPMPNSPWRLRRTPSAPILTRRG